MGCAAGNWTNQLKHPKGVVLVERNEETWIHAQTRVDLLGALVDAWPFQVTSWLPRYRYPLVLRDTHMIWLGVSIFLRTLVLSPVIIRATQVSS